ncbi:MAG TPA: histidine kinase [Prolixibacteraceae bacterium]|nr:histidine kinase [Prolixibacteraceae bacterium]
MKRLILLLLVLVSFGISYGEELSAEQKQVAWNFIYENMLSKDYRPNIFRDDITINLKGEITSEDSIIVNDLIKSFQKAIPHLKIELSDKPGNLTLGLNDVKYFRVSTNFSAIHIISSQEMHFPSNLIQSQRKKFIYYHLFRGLIFNNKPVQELPGMNGCVFAQNDFKSITFSPFDLFILEKLYAPDFHEQFKNQFIRQFSYRKYLVQMHPRVLNFIFFLLGLIIPAILLTRLVIKGSFKAHNWSWKEFNKQGSYLVAIGSIFFICFSLSDLKSNFYELLITILSAFISINVIYFLEMLILKNRNLGGAKILIIYFTTLFGMYFTIMHKDSSSNLDELNQRTLNDFFFIIKILIVPIARSLYIFLNDRYKSIINQKDVELAQLGELHKQAELQSLRAKINPHFLYNALNSIASLATTDGRKTEQMALSLSDFFKYAINREQKQLNSLSEELNAVRTYLEIEKVRFGERLNFRIDCPAELMEVQIPQLLIQPLVENAIKHGLSKITDKGLIRVSVSKEGSQLKIRVYDNGPAFPDGPLSGFGIQNTQERINLIYGVNACIDWQNSPDKYIEISLPLNNK